MMFVFGAIIAKHERIGFGDHIQGYMSTTKRSAVASHSVLIPFLSCDATGKHTKKKKNVCNMDVYM